MRIKNRNNVKVLFFYYIYNMNRFGYACINTELTAKGISSSRSMKLSTFLKNGRTHYDTTVIGNLRSLLQTLKWNEEHGIKVFRISNDLFPHKNRVTLDELLEVEPIRVLLSEIGEYAISNGHRLSFHTDAYSVLASQRESVVANAVNDINFVSGVLDAMGLECTPLHKVNVHIGTSKPSKPQAAENFINGYNLLSPSAKRRLTIENDDKPSAFTVDDLYNLIHTHIGIPIVIDYHHHSIHNDGVDLENALSKALSTWNGVRPIVHYSSSRKLYEDVKSPVTAHADFIYEKIPTFGRDFDIMLECKSKEQALLKYVSCL